MLDVAISLIPCVVAAIVFFGLKALLLILLSVVSCVASEIVWKLLYAKENFVKAFKTFDFTSLVTGIILGLNLGSQTAWYAPVLGGIFSIIVVKMLFGGTGKNFVNPAAAGRVFLSIAFPAVMLSGFLAPQIGSISGITPSTGATPLGGAIKGESPLSCLDLFLGTGVSGAAGETSKLAILLGYLYLSFRRVIDWKYPLVAIVCCGLTAMPLAGTYKAFLPSILSGGLVFGSVFMLTDYVTCPNTKLGNYICFASFGVIVALLRFKNESEVVSYVILLMNFIVPLIDRLLLPKPFGSVKEKEGKKA